MNISSAIVKADPENANQVIQTLNKSELCEVHLSEGGKIIITIEGEGIDEEIRKTREIEKLNGVMNVELIYSYSEKELEIERDKIELNNEQPEWLNNENIDAMNIPYGGNLKKKF